LPWEGEGRMYAFSEEATRGLRLTIGKMEGKLLLLVDGDSKRKGALSSQANDNWTNGLCKCQTEMANRRRRRRSVRYWCVQRVSVDKDWALVGGWH
jgi:hypothetical protein